MGSHQRPWHGPALIASLFLLLAILLGGASAAHADDEPHPMWLISTRSAPRCGDLDAAPQELQYWRSDGRCRWIAADAQAFRTTDDTAVPTIVYIHGNRTDADEAVTKSRYTYEVIRAEAADRPFRYVIWSWPAERVCRRNNDDVRLKAAYSDVESYYLARWLDGLRPGVRISLIGHSFGPRIITGALHLLAGGAVADRSLPEGAVTAWTGGRRNPVRIVLLAAAIDANWLAPGGCHGLALSLVDHALITQNGRDRVLRSYPRLNDHSGPQAMGFVGPCGVEQSKNVTVVDVSSTVGKIHDWRCYCSAANVRALWPHYTFLDE
jgi:hypothetical protein